MVEIFLDCRLGVCIFHFLGFDFYLFSLLTPESVACDGSESYILVDNLHKIKYILYTTKYLRYIKILLS
jgi:hypothetical protein